jgi:glutamine amidotransferase
MEGAQDVIHIVDYGCGNLASIANMLKKLRIPCTIAADPADLRDAERIILPGVGTFDSGMQGIRDRGLREVLDSKALDEKVPMLGICLGAQLMTRGSEEGVEPGLGWLPADTVLFDFARRQVDPLPLPNIGWRQVEVVDDRSDSSPVDPSEPARFYFVHKYHFEAEPDVVWMTSRYGFDFPCSLKSGNLMCVQFHPEKSHKYGMRMLEWFASTTVERAA